MVNESANTLRSPIDGLLLVLFYICMFYVLTLLFLLAQCLNPMQADVYVKKKQILIFIGRLHLSKLLGLPNIE